MPRKKGSAMWSGAERLRNTKPKRSPVGVGTWRMLMAIRRNMWSKSVRRNNQNILFYSGF